MSEEKSFILTIEEFFSLSPIEKIQEKDLMNFSFTLNDLNNLQAKMKLKQIHLFVIHFKIYSIIFILENYFIQQKNVFMKSI